MANDVDYDEAEAQQEQKSKSSLVDRANSAYRLGKAARHPMESINKFRGRFGGSHAPEGRHGGHPDSSQNGSGEGNEENRKKKRSAFDNFQTARNTIKNIRTAINVARYIVNPGVMWTLFGVFIFIIIYMLFFGGGSSIPNPFSDKDSTTNPPANGAQKTDPDIPGLKLTISEPPPNLPEGSSVNITVSISHDESVGNIPRNTITIFAIIPPDTKPEQISGNYTQTGSVIEWSLSSSENYPTIKFTLTPTVPSVEFDYVVSARTTGPLLSSNGVSSNVCTQPHEAGGYCSVNNLLPYFGGDEAKATTASLICKLESGGDPFAMNTNCDTNDYSVGLFQINLVAHCEGAYGEGKWGAQSCDNPLDENKRLVCSQQMKDTTQNIQKAVSLSQNGTNWTLWGAWSEANRIISSCSNTL